MKHILAALLLLTSSYASAIEPFGKKLVQDMRDGTYYFGTIRSPDAMEEEYFGITHMDGIQVGLGTFEVNLPFTGVRIYSNIKYIQDAEDMARAMGFQFMDCDHDYLADPEYPILLPVAQ